MTNQRVVATGMGVISPVGLSVSSAWANVSGGHSGIRPISLFDASGDQWRVKIAGEAWDFDPLNYMSARDSRRADRNVQFALAASIEAVDQARLSISPENADHIGVMVGSGSGGIWTYTTQQAILTNRGPHRMNPLLIPMQVVDSAA